MPASWYIERADPDSFLNAWLPHGTMGGSMAPRPIPPHILNRINNGGANGGAAITSVNNQGPQKLAPEELLREAYKLLARDKASFANTNYVPYRGATTAPMSSLTQKARSLEEQYGTKPPPFSRKLQSVVSRPQEGVPLDDLIGRLRASQAGSVREPMREELQKQFGAYYTPARQERFQRKTDKDITLGSREAAAKFGNVDQAVKTLNDRNNRELTQTLGVLQDEKQARRNALISNLQEFGNQKHAYGNFVNGVNRKSFEQEAKEPYKRMQLLESALAPYQNMVDGGIHPDLGESTMKGISQALRAYGVDPSKPSNQWDTQRTSSRYPEKMVADLPDETKSSYDLLERINPKIKDDYADRRKEIVGGLMRAPSLGRRATENMTPALNDQMALLDKQAKDRLKKDLGSLNAKYTQLGQYNSPQHMGEADLRAREINKSALEARQRLMEDELKRQVDLETQSSKGNLENLHTLARQGLKDYGNVLQDVRGLNKLGATKWRNEQDELEDLYKNYQNERMWEWPHMRNATRSEAHGEIFGNAATRGISLDELANLRSRYSELERDRSQLSNEIQKLQGDIRTNQQYYDTRLGEFNRLEQARREQEAARQRQQQEIERQRAEEARRSREAAERTAREEQERNRLAELQRLSTPNMKEWIDFQQTLRNFNGQPNAQGYYYSPRLRHYDYTLGFNRYDPADESHLHYGDIRNNTPLGQGYLTSPMIQQLQRVAEPQFLRSYKHENSRWLEPNSNIWRAPSMLDNIRWASKHENSRWLEPNSNIWRAPSMLDNIRWARR